MPQAYRNRVNSGRIPQSLAGILVVLGGLALVMGGGLEARGEDAAVKAAAEAPKVVAEPLVRLAAVAPMIEVVPRGGTAGQTWVTKGVIFKNPKSGHWVQMLIKKTSRAAREFVVATLDLNTGVIKDLGEIKGYGQSKTAWTGGKFYFTTWLPGGFYVYDPETDAIRKLDDAFTGDMGAFRMSVSPDGVLTLGAGPGTDLSFFDPKTEKLTKIGALSAKHSYVYELGSDEKYAYAGLRSKSPWMVMSVNKATGEKKVLLEAPPEGYVKISGTTARVTQDFSKGVWQHYKLVDGGMVAVDPPAEPPPATQPAATAKVAETVPMVVIDETPILDGGDKLQIDYQDPADLTKWKAAMYPAVVASEGILAATVMGDGKIAAMTGPYNPAILYDPKTDKTIQAPFSPVSGRAMIAIGPVVYGTGYPSTTLVRWDTSKPVTKVNNPADKGNFDWSKADANPRNLGTWAMSVSSGGHMGVRLFEGADGMVYILTARHRHNLGYDVVWYNPTAQTKGEIEDGGVNDHNAASWACLVDGGKKMVVSTTVEPNRQLTTPVPEEAKIQVIDLVNRAYLESHRPVPGTKAYVGVVEVSPGVIVGTANGANNTTTVYRYNLGTRKLEASVVYEGIIQGQHGTTSLPGKGRDFVLGPDGKIWTGMETGAEMSALLKIDPATLKVQILGRLGRGDGRYLFTDGKVYLTGFTTLMEIPALGGK
jgi:hypothetical protein